MDNLVTTPPPSIVFRTDASLEIGTGHVMRCLTLADALRDRGADCRFVCRSHSGHLLAEIGRRGHRVAALPPPPSGFAASADDPLHAGWLGIGWARDAEETRLAMGGEIADWLVVDHYALDRRWQRVLRPATRRLLVLDDLADRPHDCDLVLDPTLGRTDADYRGLIPSDATVLLGPRYALLRPEFAALRAESLARRRAPQLRRLLITMGGVDKDNATGRVLDALNASALSSDLRITVVMGPHAPWLTEVQAQAARMRFETQVQTGVKDMARLMTDSDLAIGAGGGTSWERCCLGLPAFTLCLAENQYEMTATLQDAGAVIATKSAQETARCIADYVTTKGMEAFLIRASRAAAQITDGQGRERICRMMLA